MKNRIRMLRATLRELEFLIETEQWSEIEEEINCLRGDTEVIWEGVEERLASTSKA